MEEVLEEPELVLEWAVEGLSELVGEPGVDEDVVGGAVAGAVVVVVVVGGGVCDVVTGAAGVGARDACVAALA